MGLCFGGTCGKEPACRCRRPKRHGFDTWVGRSPGDRHDKPLQHFCLENPTDRGAWWATIHKVAKSWTRLKWLSTHTRDLGSLDKTGWDSLAGKDRSLARSRLDRTRGKKSLAVRLASFAREALSQFQLSLEVITWAEEPPGQLCSLLWSLLNPYLAKDAQYFLSTHIPFLENMPLSHPDPEPLKVSLPQPRLDIWLKLTFWATASYWVSKKLRSDFFMENPKELFGQPINSTLQEILSWKFPGDPGVRTQRFHCQGLGSIPGQETNIP